MAVADKTLPRNLFQPQGRPVGSVIISLPKDTTPPGAISLSRVPSLSRTGEVGRNLLTSPVRHPTGKTRQPFRRCLVPSTTCQHTNEKPTALQASRRLPPLLLRPLSPTAAFQTPGRPHAGHRLPAGSCPGSQVNGGLRSTVRVASGKTHGPIVVCARLPPGHSRKAVLALFPGTEGRSVPVPLDDQCSQFGIVSGRTHWQALDGPFMVELFAIWYFTRMPGLVEAPVPPVTRLETPHASWVERTSRDLHPNGPVGLWSGTPQTGFAPALCRHRPFWPSQPRKACPCRPPSGSAYRVERRDCSAA